MGGTMQRCDKCGRAVPAGGLFYDLTITLDQGFDGVIAGEQDGDLPSLMKRLDQQTRGVPERLLEEDVHKVMRYRLCVRCRERFAANPLDLPLDARDVPRNLSDLES
jgi:hypothetical protein